MASAFEEGPMGGGFPFFIAGVSLLSACFVALCAACKRKDESKLSSQDDEQVLCEEPAVPGLTAPLALGGSLPSLQHSSGRDPEVTSITPAPLTPPRPSDKDDNTVGSCSFLILHQRDLPNVPSSPEVTYSNLSFPKRVEVMLCESQSVEGEENQNGHPVADKIVENIPGHQAQAGEPSYACIVKKKKTTNDGKQTCVEMDKPQEMSPLTSTALSPPTKEIEEMYSVVCKEKKKKKAQRSEGAGKEAAPQAKGNPGHLQEMMASQESNGIASYQSSSVPTATEPYYDTVLCESLTKVASQPVAEPAYESVDTYWNKVKKKAKAPKKKMAPENVYESIN